MSGAEQNRNSEHCRASVQQFVILSMGSTAYFEIDETSEASK